MNMKKNSGKRRHPYASLAIFTIAAAGIINITNRAKKFVREKTESVKNFMMHKKAD